MPFLQTWDKTTTSNRSEHLSDSADDRIKDDHVAGARYADSKRKT